MRIHLRSTLAVTLAAAVMLSCGDSKRASDDNDGGGDGGDGGAGGSRAGGGSGGTAGHRAGSSGASDGGAAGSRGGTGAAGMSGAAVGGSSQGGSVEGGGAGEATAGAIGSAGAGDTPNDAQPLPNCTTSGWCWDNPTPGGSNLNGVWAGAPDNVWAVGMGGLILRYDGKRWQRFKGPTTERLNAVWGTSADAVWIGGSGGLFFWNGKEFVTYPVSLSSVIDVHGSAPNNVRSTLGTQAIGYFDGSKLTQPILTEGGPTSSVLAVWTFEPHVAYGAGSGGTIIRADGPFAMPFDYTTSIVYAAGGYLEDLWGTTADEPLWAVGESGLVVSGHVDQKTSFQVLDAGTVASLYGVWGSSQSDIWTVGDTGTILHYDGKNWTDRSLATAVDLRDIDGTGKNDVWAVGTDGSIFHFDGASWSAPNTLTHQELFGVWGTSDDDVWAVGDRGALLHKDASGWQALESPTTAAIRSVYTAAPDDVWFVADDSNIYHFDGTDFAVSFTPRYYASFLWGRAGDDIWAAGGGDQYRYDGESWQPFTLPFNGFFDVWASSATDLWISRGRDGYYHLKDGVATSGNDFAMGYLWGTGPDDIWSVHDDSGIRHWDGQSWTVVPASSLSSPHGMWASAPENMWIVGSLGTTDFFDGVAVHHVTDTSDDELDATLNGVWVSPTGIAYAVGTAGTIVVHGPGLE